LKVYTGTHRTDWPLQRVIQALERYAPPDIEIVSDQSDAELVVLHVIGRRNHTAREINQIQKVGMQYAIIQYSLRSTLQPCTSAWLPLWRGAVLTWSYYNLESWCRQDWTPFDFPFYHAPLGVDKTVFYPRRGQRGYVIGTSGHSAVVEGIREAAFATKQVSGTMFHLGPELGRGNDIVCKSNLTDNELAELLSQCQFVACLRRTEGFELMAAEGILCGARPICFDRDHYRQWHEPWAVFIPEGSREDVIDSLAAVFRHGTEPVTQEEMDQAASLFDWEQIVSGFWNGCLD